MKKTKLIMIGTVLGIAIVLRQHRSSQPSELADESDLGGKSDRGDESKLADEEISA